MPQLGSWTTLLTTPPASRNLYVSYLQTEVLVQVVNRCDHELYLDRARLSKLRRDVILGVREDCLLELRGRQLELFKGPEDQDDPSAPGD
jgi:hypothetical protein